MKTFKVNEYDSHNFYYVINDPNIANNELVRFDIEDISQLIHYLFVKKVDETESSNKYTIKRHNGPCRIFKDGTKSYDLLVSYSDYIKTNSKIWEILNLS